MPEVHAAPAEQDAWGSRVGPAGSLPALSHAGSRTSASASPFVEVVFGAASQIERGIRHARAHRDIVQLICLSRKLDAVRRAQAVLDVLVQRFAASSNPQRDLEAIRWIASSVLGHHSEARKCPPIEAFEVGPTHVLATR